jgi:hypothetical protein
MLERKCISGLSKNGKYTKRFSVIAFTWWFGWQFLRTGWRVCILHDSGLHPPLSEFRSAKNGPIISNFLLGKRPHVHHTSPYIDASGRILSAIGIDQFYPRIYCMFYEHFLGHVYWFKPGDIVSTTIYHHLISYVVSIPHVSCLHEFHLREFYLRWLPFLRE